jgi:hypothetical protein
MSDQTFDKVFEFIKRKSIPNVSMYFKKLYYQEFYQDLVLQHVYDYPVQDDNKQYKENVFTLENIALEEPYDSLTQDDDVLISLYQKTNVPISAFPSTTQIYETALERRITFKINNRIYLNICTKMYESDDNKKNYKYLMLNFQPTNSNEISHDIVLINKVIDAMKSF